MPVRCVHKPGLLGEEARSGVTTKFCVAIQSFAMEHSGFPMQLEINTF